MIPLAKLKEDMRFGNELKDMIEVLKGVASTQFRNFQREKKGFEDFKLKLEEFLLGIKASEATHFFLTEKPNLPKAIVMITSDEGFLGGLNASVISAALEHAAGNDELIVLGERGARYLSENQNAAFTFLPGIGDDVTYQRAATVRDLLVSKFLSNKIGSVLISCPRFLSLTVQRVDVVRVLPCKDIFVQEETGLKKRYIAPKDILIEPTKDQVLDYIIRIHLMQRLYDMFWESKLSEYAARIIHLEGSHKEAVEFNKKLKYEYFKHLHEESNKNIREIFASRLKWRTAT